MTATPTEIKTAYRRQALEWHPDKRQGSREAEERFKKIAAAYEVLRDPAKRARYDASVKAADLSAYEEGAYDLRAAENLFVQEMSELASELARANLSLGEIVERLRAAGCPLLVATRLAKATRDGWQAGAGSRLRKRSRTAAFHLLAAVAAFWLTEACERAGATTWLTTAFMVLGSALIFRSLWLFGKGLYEFNAARS